MNKPFGVMTVSRKRKRGSYGGDREIATARFDAASVSNHDGLLMVSFVAPSSVARAIIAALYADEDLNIVFRHDDFTRHNVGKAGKYQVRKAKLAGDLWHVVATVKRDGFFPVMTDDCLWSLLTSDQVTTPVCREWLPYLKERLVKRYAICKVENFRCECGLVNIDGDLVDRIVREGLRSGNITIPGRNGPAPTYDSLDSYLSDFGVVIGKQAETTLNPVHVPGRDDLLSPPLLRKLFPAQDHCVTAIIKTLRRQKVVLFSGEMGTGKTISGMAAVHGHAAGKSYRALVFCPGQLVNKWKREIEQSIFGAKVTIIESWRDVVSIDPKAKPAGPEWFVISRDRAKLGSCWRPACTVHNGKPAAFCPKCGYKLLDKNGLSVDPDSLARKKSNCEYVAGRSGEQRDGCGERLWQSTREIDRYEPALFIKNHLRGYFRYLILDEVHEEKGQDTAQANAAGALIAACGKVICLTGTLVGGYAEHLRPLLFRVAARQLRDEGFTWGSVMPFSERYGRIETRITEKGSEGGESNRQSRGKVSKAKSVRPGIMPSLFGRHLLDKTIFLGLGDVADNLPEIREECIEVDMDPRQAEAYRKIESDLADAMRPMLVRGDRRLLGAMLQTLLAYPDYPFNWSPVGYMEQSAFVTVTIPPGLDDSVVWPKEQALIDLCFGEKMAGRKVWVYVQYTEKHAVADRLASLMKKIGIKVAILRQNVAPADREAWIAKNAPGVDVIISHPKLVETGLDFFDKSGTYNVPTVVFYETGYNLFTLRQASRRAWRIGQWEPCRVVYLYYSRTMQERAMSLMGMKLTAALALEGTFSEDGLAVLAGDDGGPVEMALARSLAEKLNLDPVSKAWSKVTNLTGE